MAAGGDEAAATHKSSVSFLSLPTETQREILSHCCQSDLICVALVSKHFHEIASAILYRNFHIIFPDDDDLNFDSPIDGLAGGLDTFTTSDYNYAKHLRDLSMDTLSGGSKGEMSYQPYLYSSSCGKFLNTLLYLTLKKAHALEVFRWNIRVELSRPVYRELHRIRTLKSLHVRMQAGDSYYVPPPPLPITFQGHPPPPPLPPPPPPIHSNSHWSDLPPPSLPSLSLPPLPLAATSPPLVGGPPPLHGHARSTSNNRFSKHHPQEPPRLSGFKSLKTLCILDIDDLDVVPELKACVKNSYSTLTELQLSLSSSLASQSRKPVPESESEDSEPEYFDEPASHHSHFDNTGPARTFRAQEEKKKQDAILGRVFDVEANLQKKPQMQLGPENGDAKGKAKSTDAADAADPREQFVLSLRGVSSKLLSMANGSKDVSASHQDILDTIEKAARKYVGSVDLSSLSATDAPEQGESQPRNLPSGESSSARSATKLDAQSTEDQNQHKGEGKEKDIETLPASSSRKSFKNGRSKDASPDDIDIEHPDTVEDALDDIEEQDDTAWNEVAAKDCQDTPNADSLAADASASKPQANAKEPVKTVTSGQVEMLKCGDRDTREVSMDDYLRDTRGLSLEVLKVYLVPVKASVISRAINISTLKELTLLNVGNQAPIWTLLANENRAQPLALRSIFTDNVSNAFLTFVSQLKELHDLFMLERSVAHKPESFAPRASITIDQIRRLVLKKHISTLRRLSIKDESKEANWDANEKSMILICNQGRQLEELAVSMNIHAVHAFMQYFSGLVNLRAINILHFKNNDTCLWVMRETLRFIVDNLSHNPALKLEWIAMEDDRVDRVVRPSESDYHSESEDEKKVQTKDGKKVAKAQAGSSSQSNTYGFPELPTEGLDSDSEGEEDAFDCGTRLRFKTVGPLQFYDVWGVKIFEKEIRNGRL